MAKETVLFICSFNSVRSRIAESLLSARCGERYAVFSAGIAPASFLRMLQKYRAKHLVSYSSAAEFTPGTPVTNIRLSTPLSALMRGL